MNKKNVPGSVDAYITGFPKNVQKILLAIRSTVKKAAPKAEESISYGMPGYKLQGPLVYFGAFKKHIGFYPTPSATSKFKKELAKYAGAKGSIQFPLDKPMPLALISKITKFRIKANIAKAKLLKKTK